MDKPLEDVDVKRVPNALEDVGFKVGTADDDGPEWRDVVIDDDEDPDDEELAVTPAGVIMVLGFDPLDIDTW